MFWAIAAHQIIMEDLEKQAEINTKYELACLASIPQVRMTRRIVGAYTLKSKEKACQYVDSIGMIANWRARGEIYEIPYGTLYSPNFSNMLAAGRCISASGPMWDICRVIPGCAIPGKQLVSQPLCKKMFVSCQRTCCRKNLQNKVSFFIEMGEKLSSKYNM